MLLAHRATPWGKITPTATPSTVFHSLCSHFKYGNTSSAVRPLSFIMISDFMVGGTPGKGVPGIVAPAVKPSGQPHEVHIQIKGTNVTYI